MATAIAADGAAATRVVDPSISTLLARTGLFQHLSLDEIAQITRRLEGTEQRAFQPGNVLIRQAQPGKRCYLLLRGRVQVTLRHDPESPSQVPTELAILEAGDVVGEMSLLDGLPCSATVTALESTHCLALTSQELTELLIQHPRVALSMLATISRRLRATEAMLPVPRAEPQPDHASVPW